MKKILVIFLALTSAAFAALPAQALDKDPVHTGRFSNVAVGGYDVVSYFAAGAPTKGSTDYQTTYKGADFQFSSQENLDTFTANPGKYAPQFGGYCAWAVGQGYTAPGSPKHWRIVDGKLYLNFNASIKERWEQDIPGNIAKANANWPSVLAN